MSIEEEVGGNRTHDMLFCRQPPHHLAFTSFAEGDTLAADVFAGRKKTILRCKSKTQGKAKKRKRPNTIAFGRRHDMGRLAGASFLEVHCQALVQDDQSLREKANGETPKYRWWQQHTSFFKQVGLAEILLATRLKLTIGRGFPKHDIKIGGQFSNHRSLQWFEVSLNEFAVGLITGSAKYTVGRIALETSNEDL